MKDNKTITPRKAFTVIIHHKEYDVYNINGKEHEGLNNTIKTWWLYYSDRMPGGLTPPHDSDSWKPFDVSIIRRLWEIRVVQHNSSKEKWGSTQFRNSVSVEMWCNKKLVYSFASGGKYLEFAFAKIQYLQVTLSEHCYNFFEPETENGRKICWYGLPATIKVKSNTWEIGIIPDYTAGLEKKEWWEEYRNRTSKYSKVDADDLQSDREDDEESMQADYINWGDALSDQHIYWFRK